MKNAIAAVLTSAVTLLANAAGGHNGIQFEMTQKQVEARGFFCKAPEEKGDFIAECHHMDMTGIAFGFPTKDYELLIGSKGKVDMISAKFSRPLDTPDYFELQGKIVNFFPKKDEKASFQSSVARRDQWSAKDNSSLVLLYMTAVPPIRKESMSVTFWSSRAMLRAAAKSSKAPSEAKAASSSE